MVIGVACAALAFAPGALADDNWLPHPPDATWTYQWSDSVYASTPTTEKVTVGAVNGVQFNLDWAIDQQPSTCDSKNTAATGVVSFEDGDSGIIPTNWCSSPPPATMPILCAQATSCANSVASSYYTIIWGALDTPLLEEPLQKGLTWSSTGGTGGSVSANSKYVGQQKVSVPAFPAPVTAAVVKTDITQAGALGDPYGSGTRTTWWVYGVGPVKSVFVHQGGAGAVTTAVLQSTNQTPAEPPTDADYFPMTQGQSHEYRWTNTKHLTKPEVEKLTVAAVQNGTARFTAANVSGPIKVQGEYFFTKRVDGVTNTSGASSSSTKLAFPPLGPRGAPPTNRNRFVTPFDLMDFGIASIMPGYPAAGSTWTQSSLDVGHFGVKGSSTVVGIQKVTVPAGTFQALVVRSTLTQQGFPFGSGTRTSWFAPGKGLVKLVFAHADHSVSTVELLK